MQATELLRRRRVELASFAFGFALANLVWHARRRQDALGVAEEHAEGLGSLLERQDRFLHDAAHELRTPMTIARGHLELLERGAESPRPEIGIALDELARMERIVDRLLLLARADQPDFLEVADLQLDAFLEDVFVRWSEVAPRTWQLGRLAHGVVRADAEQLRIALDALLENAVKYTDTGDRIELSSRELGGGVAVEVADEGIGIPDAALPHIFERFARADAARTRAAGGVGLGLAIVDTIVKAHGARARAERRQGETVFAIELPDFSVAAPDAQPVLAAPVAAPLS